MPTPTPTPTPTPVTGSATDTLVLDVSEDAWQGDAQYAVTIDGTQVGGVMTATASHAAGNTAAITIPVTAGGHVVGITFLNDAYGGSNSTDRNLYVDGAQINGQPIPASTLVLQSNGTSTFGFAAPDASGATIGNTPAPASSLVLNISEDAYQGDARYTIAVDGTQVGGVRSASASHATGQTEAVSVPIDFGGHNIAVSFLNDRYDGPTQDRNLYVDSVSVEGQSLPGSSIRLLSDGTSAFGVMIPHP